MGDDEALATAETNWGTLLEALIDASWQDSQHSREHEFSGAEVQFLAKYGAEAPRSRLETAVKASRDRNALAERPKH